MEYLKGWAHARRNFADLYKASKDPRAEMAVRQIAGLYRLEKKIRHRPVEKIRQWRQRYARPVLDKLWQWLEQQKDECPESSALGKAISYALKRQVALSRFLENGGNVAGNSSRILGGSDLGGMQILGQALKY